MLLVAGLRAHAAPVDHPLLTSDTHQLSDIRRSVRVRHPPKHPSTVVTDRGVPSERCGPELGHPGERSTGTSPSSPPVSRPTRSLAAILGNA